MSLTEKLTRPLKVARKISETPDACSLVFDIPSEHRHEFDYRPGQFVTLFLELGGELLHRSYSLSTSPLVDSEFKITVKKVLGGRGSSYLVDQVREGDILRVTPPAGEFFRSPSSGSCQHYIFLAAGSGITPVFSILKSVLFDNQQNFASLFYLNRDEEHIIYRNELDRLKEQYGQRLRIWHQLTKPSALWTGERGRLSQESFNQFYNAAITPLTLTVDAYLCGPVEFMELGRSELLRMDVDPTHIHIESFGEAVGKAAHSDFFTGKTLIGPDELQKNEKPMQIQAVLNGEEIEITAVEGQSVLETLLNAGWNAPYSCMEGSCMACLAKVLQGKVFQDDPGILTDENVSGCETLTCQAKPLSKIVRIDYDNL